MASAKRNPRREAAATATIGAGLTFSGGMLRHAGVRDANHGAIPSWKPRHPIRTSSTRALLRRGARGRVFYATGAAAGLAGAPALAVGVHNYRKVRKDDQHRPSFVRVGVRGTSRALHQKARSVRESPPQAKIGPLAVGAGAGALGSLGAHRTLDRVKAFRGARHGTRAGVAATAGALAAGVSYPLARHLTPHGYEVTPTGVRRKRTTAKRPSSGQKVLDGRAMDPRQFRQGVVGKGLLDAPVGRTTTPYGEADVFRMPGGGLVACGREGSKMVTRALPRDWSYANTKQPHPMEVSRRRAAQAIRAHTASERATRQKRDARGRFTKAAPRRAAIGYAAGAVAGDRLARPLARRARGALIRRGHSKERADAVELGIRGLGATTGGTVGAVGGIRFRKDDYLGRRTSRHAQTAAILGAGSTPFVGNVAAATAASRYAPPGQNRKAAVRQYVGGAGGATAGGVAGAYGLSHLAHRYGSVDRAAQRASTTASSARAKARGLRPVNATMARVDRVKAKMPKGSGKAAARVGRAKEAAMATRLAKPLRRSPVAAGVGLVAGKTIGGWVGGGTAMQRNFSAQNRYNLKHPAVKKNDPTGLSRKDQETILRRKRRGTHTQELTSSLGLAGAAMGATLLPGVRGRLKPKTAETIQRTAIGTGLASGGIAGVHGIRSARLQRRELNAQERAMSKGMLVSKGAIVPANVAERAHRMAIAAARRGNTEQQRRMLALRNRMIEQPVRKADQRQPLTRMREDQAHQLVRRYGHAGPLPKELTRQQRMDAYAARYVHAGGHKAEHYQHRADVADRVKTGALAGATAGGAAMLALKHRRIAGALGRHAERARHSVDAATIGAATAGGAAELYAGHARRRRSSYSNSKAGVAASALRRMQDYSS